MMADNNKSVLVVGFNTRPLAYSLKTAGYKVYAVDFFGDIDLYPSVLDSFVLINELKTNYSSIKGSYSGILAKYTIKMLKKYRDIDYLIIGSGLDDALEERKTILKEIKEGKYKIENLNNDLNSIKNSRSIEQIYKYLKFHNYIVPVTIPYQIFKNYIHNLQFPIIFKKSKSAGGINVFKINNYEELTELIEKFNPKQFNPLDWITQEYIEGNPISCTTISNGRECEVISINQQIIGEKKLYPPKEYMYCGNVVPIHLPKKVKNLIKAISKMLTISLGLKGINGFDYVLQNNYPYLMEVNPRIPGSIRASELSYNINLLDLHIKSFNLSNWEYIQKSVSSMKSTGYATKLIMFSPKEIDRNLLAKINELEYVHDKSEPTKSVLKGEPLCTILFKEKTLSESYNGAFKIIDKINKIIS
ncbi:MAG: ATP-grasp domain-containing protein [Candidatus Thorarchaeota archaeon]